MGKRKEIYEKYIISPRWREFATTIKSQRKRCQVCGCEMSLHCHHLTYKNLGHEKPEDVAVLCSNCHYVAHLLLSDKSLYGNIKGRKLKNQLKMLKKLVMRWYSDQERTNRELYQ